MFEHAMKAVLKISFVVMLIVLGGFGIVRLRQQTARLENEASTLRRKSRALEDLRQDNAQLRRLMDHMQRDDAEAAGVVEKDIGEARRHIADLEERARASSAKSTERSAAMKTSRNPETGLTRLDHFQNIGRASPAAAFQTLVWAALKGDDAALSTACYLDDATRQKALALLARLPDKERQKFRTPESLAALAVSGEMMKGTALHIIKSTPVDGLNTLVTIRTGENGREIALPMRQGVDGWQFVVPERAIEAIELRMRAEAPLPVGKK